MIIHNADPFQASTPHCIRVSPCKLYPSSQDRVAMYPKVVPLASAKPLTGAGSPQSSESKSKCLYQSKWLMDCKVEQKTYTAGMCMEVI